MTEAEAVALCLPTDVEDIQRRLDDLAPSESHRRIEHEIAGGERKPPAGSDVLQPTRHAVLDAEFVTEAGHIEMGRADVAAPFADGG